MKGLAIANNLSVVIRMKSEYMGIDTGLLGGMIVGKMVVLL